uniref:Proliferation-associated SNF2-like protein n=1 Tax=Phallusia mammillata TaxID=59560 RepID=A0A6F9DDR7_9ASCI|nr:chromatin structure-remodeling complex subunit snf21-like [Phallusia mammillata]
MHLWNLLTRSNFYASSLLTIIEEKQKKRFKTPSSNKKHKKTKHHKSVPLVDNTETVVMSVVRNLVSKVVEMNVTDNDDPKNTTITDNLNFTADSETGLMNNLLEPVKNVKIEHFSSGSDIVSSIKSADTIEEVSNDGNEFQEANYITEQPDQVVSEEDYRRNLSKRRGVMTNSEDCKPPLNNFDNQMKPESVTDVTMTLSPYNENVESSPDSTPDNVIHDETKAREEAVDENNSFPLEDNETNVGLQISVKSEKRDSEGNYPVSIMSAGNYHSSQDNDLNSKTCSEKVCCPICDRKYSLKSINKHLDVCTGRDEARESLRSRNKTQLKAHRPLTPAKCKQVKQSATDSCKNLVKCESPQNSAFPQAQNTSNKKTIRDNQKKANENEEGQINFENITKIENIKRKRKANKIALSLFGTRHISTRRSCVDVSSTEVIQGPSSITPNEIVQENRNRVCQEKMKGQTGLQNIKNALEKTILATKTVNEKLFAEAKEVASRLEAEKREKEKLELTTKSKQVMSPPHKTRKTNILKTPKVKPHTKTGKHKKKSIQSSLRKDEESLKENPINNSPEENHSASLPTEKATDIERQNAKETSLVKPTKVTTDEPKARPLGRTEVESVSIKEQIPGSCCKSPNPWRKSPGQLPLPLRMVDDCNMETSSSDGVEIEIPAEPTRRSSRVRSKISYQEVESSDEESDANQEKRVKKVKPSQRMKQKIMKKSDDEYEVPEKECSKTLEEKTTEKSNEEQVNEEEGELGSEINVEALLEKRFHQPNVRSYQNLVTNLNGNRYIQGELVDPSQPKLLIGGILREYQIVGYQWLKILYENGESGILADEMGLGKTVQCIALICKLIRMKVNGPFLVCAPTTTINNWLSEFKRFAPQVSVLLYYGSALERVHLVECLIEQTKIQTQLVVITSYEILMRDLPVLRTYRWSYLVLDEGHRVKNLNCKTLKDIKVISTKGKVMLTGTPLQNNLTELWSLLNFLFPEVFDDVKSFQSWFDMDLLKNDDKILSMLHQVLTPFLLRRIKADVDIKIPPKREMLVMAPLAPLQDQYYRAVVDKSIIQLIKDQEYYDVTPGVADPDLIASNSQEEKTTRNTRSCLKQKYGLNVEDFAVNVTLSNMMMLLRKCCNHPYLLHHPYDANTMDLKIDDELVTSCGKMMLLDKMLPQLKLRGHKVLLFSQMTTMLDIIEDYCELRQFKFVRFDGKTKCQDRVEYIDKFNSDPTIFIFLLSTRAGGIGINLTGADTVIIYDSDWNPQNDIQAQDRCHRIGQEKPVVVYRLVTASTIDQQIMERAARKRMLEKMIIHENKFKGELSEELHNLKSINPTQLLHLLESNQAQCKPDVSGNIISDSELQQLLDRSDMIGSSPCVKPPPHTSDEGKVDVRQFASGSSGSVVEKRKKAFQVIEETKRERVFVF